MSPHPKTTPLEAWPQGWLVLECSSILKNPSYIIMTDHERRLNNYPITEDEMRELIRIKGNHAASS